MNSNEPSDHALDELLRDARWPVMDPAAGERLRGTWRAAFDAPRHAWRPAALAAAAALACAALAGWWLLRSDRERTLVTGPVVEQVQPVALLNPIPRGQTREPTPFERLLVMPPRDARREPAPAPTPAEGVAEPPRDERARAEWLLASRDARDLNAFLQLVLNESTRHAALRALREAEHRPVEALIAQLANPRVERRFAAARALGEVCEPAVVERLWRMVARDVYRREALAALTQCHDPRAGRYLAIARDAPALESQLRSVRQQMERIF